MVKVHETEMKFFVWFVLMTLSKRSFLLKHNLTNLIYEEENTGLYKIRSYTIRETDLRTALLCPKNYFISKISFHFVVNKGDNNTIYTPVQILSMDTFEKNINSDMDFINSDTGAMAQQGNCDTLEQCIGYQACLFRFSNEFCKNDPVPNFRKIIQLSITCERDDGFETGYRNVQIRNDYEQVPDVIDHMVRRRHHVMYLQYKTKLEEGLRNYEDTDIKAIEIRKEQVFDVRCSDIGLSRFVGNCGSIDTSLEDHAGLSMWTTLGRTVTAECRREQLEIYCVYLMNKQGECIPPFLIKEQPTRSANVFQSTNIFNERSMPYNGERPDLTNYKQVYADPKMELIPSRLAFFILTHKSPEALMQLLGQIVRHEHYYVIHVDLTQDALREALARMIQESYPGWNNIRIIPKYRSFAASWGSYEIIRAQLECLEELLRMGIWDFAVNLSGLDLAIRSVDDLSKTLAPFRGRTFVRLNQPIDYSKDRPVLNAWHKCDGHVYNITSREPREETIYSASNWGIYAREFTDYLVSQQKEEKMTKFHFFLQTSFIPDESFIPSILQQSNFKATYAHGTMHHMNHFGGDNINNLCRHSDDVDYCGKGPETFTPDNIPDIQAHTHWYFFARKFSGNPSDPTRHRVLSDLTRDTYTKSVLDILTDDMIQYMSDAMVSRLQLVQEISLVKVNSVRVLPQPIGGNPCCEVPHQRGLQFVHDYAYWLEAEVAVGSDLWIARGLLEPYMAHRCYPLGHIRAIHLTTRQDKFSKGQPSPDRREYPIPYDPAGGDIIWLTLYLSITETSQICQDHFRRILKTFPEYKYSYFKPESNPFTPRILDFAVTMVSPQGKERCTVNIKLEMSQKTVPKDGDSTVFQHPVTCGTVLTQGVWTLRLKQKDDPNGIVYEQSIILIQRSSDLYLEPGLLSKMWRVRSAILADPMRDNYYYENIGMTNHNETLSLKPTEVPVKHYPEQIPTFSEPIFSSSDDEGRRSVPKDFYLIVGIVAVMVYLSLFLWCSKYRVRRDISKPNSKCIPNRTKRGFSFHIVIIGLLIIGFTQFIAPLLFLDNIFSKREAPRNNDAPIQRDIRNGHALGEQPLQKRQQNFPEKDIQFNET